MISQAQIRLDHTTDQGNGGRHADNDAVWQTNHDMRPPERGPDWPWRRLVTTVSIVMSLLIVGVVAVMLGWIHPASLGV